MLLELRANGLTAVATDGRRLARQEGPAKSVGRARHGRQHHHRPHPGHATAGAGLADNEENVQLAARENDVLVKSGRATIY